MKLLSKNSGMQSIDNLYDSIEKLGGQQYWWIEACRNMLLSSRNATGEHYEDLKLNMDGNLTQESSIVAKWKIAYHAPYVTQYAFLMEWL
ncbi:hypothetical protein IEQ34_000815 [Dendrobium chrysotoxum]|uniref:Uncharacterized protein n=1 Tax=Dendrobium chrysotoxum TaxID=161865 RepID=A0AAV7HU14_DENCH|nr:hypothetical protein IEQ34_000815 [Dendrobium chrysotoxum]